MPPVTAETLPGEALHDTFFGPEEPHAPAQLESSLRQPDLSEVRAARSECEHQPESGITSESGDRIARCQRRRRNCDEMSLARPLEARLFQCADSSFVIDVNNSQPSLLHRSRPPTDEQPEFFLNDPPEVVSEHIARPTQEHHELRSKNERFLPHPIQHH